MSNYVYDGRFRRRKLTVDFKTASGESVDGYPKTYLITNAFVNPGNQNGSTRALGDNEPPVNMNFYQISLLQFARMNDQAYQTRLLGFLNYVESQNPGLNRDQHLVPGYEATGINTTACPLGDEGPDDPNLID